MRFQYFPRLDCFAFLSRYPLCLHILMIVFFDFFDFFFEISTLHIP